MLLLNSQFIAAKPTENLANKMRYIFRLNLKTSELILISLTQLWVKILLLT